MPWPCAQASSTAVHAGSRSTPAPRADRRRSRKTPAGCHISVAQSRLVGRHGARRDRPARGSVSRRRSASRAPAGSRALASIARPARPPNTRPSSSELLARRFAPWTPVQATSPAAKSPGSDVRPSRSVGDAAHQVVGGGSDRQPVGGQVEPDAPAERRQQRKPRPHLRGRQVREREIHRPPGPLGFAHDRARHAIARRQIAGRLRSADMKGSPRSLMSRAPSPRSASDSR